MNTKQIKYIEEGEDVLQLEVDYAITKTNDELLIEYCKHIVANYAIAGIDILTYPIEKKIYYIENESE